MPPNLLTNYNLSAADKIGHFSEIFNGSDFEKDGSVYGNVRVKHGISKSQDYVTDMELCGSDGSVMVHRGVIAPLSSFLAEMSPDCCHDVTKIVLAETKVDVLSMVVRLLYTGKILMSGQLSVFQVVECLKMLRISENVIGSLHFSHDTVPKEKLQLSSQPVIQHLKPAEIPSKTYDWQPDDKTRSEKVLISPNINHSPGTEQHYCDTEMKDGYHDEMPDDTNYKFKCQLCDFKSRYWRRMLDHSLLHEGEMFHCNYCEYKASKLTSVKTHEYNQHVGHGSVKCDVCGFKTKTSSLMTKHIRLKHSDGKQKPKKGSWLKKRMFK